MKICKTIGKGLLIGMLFSAAALAQQGAVQLDNKAEQWEAYTDESGAEQQRLVAATRVVPGESIVFTVTYTNNGAEPAESIRITNPVPEHMDYVEGSASGDNTTIVFSVDDGASFAAADQLQVDAEDGTQRPAAAADYTHVRWTLNSDIEPGAGGNVQFTAVVE